MIFGNDLAVSAVWADGLDECGQKYPDVFPVRAMTHGQRASAGSDSASGERETTTFVIPLPDLPPSVARVEWVKSQQVDQSLSSVLTSVLPVSELGNVVHSYFLKDDLLVGWMPFEGDFVGEPVF